MKRKFFITPISPHNNIHVLPRTILIIIRLKLINGSFAGPIFDQSRHELELDRWKRVWVYKDFFTKLFLHKIWIQKTGFGFPCYSSNRHNHWLWIYMATMIITIMTILTKLISNHDIEERAVMINFVLILFFLTQTQLVMSSSSTTSLPNHGRRRRRGWVSRISRQYKRQATLAPSTPHGVRNVCGLVRPCMPALLAWFVQGTAAVAVVGPPFHAGVAPSYAPFEDAPNHPVGGRGSSGGHVCDTQKVHRTHVTPTLKRENVFGLRDNGGHL